MKTKEHELHPVTRVVDTSENDAVTPTVRYEITSYGADYDVAGFVSRLERHDIEIPAFQRDYVWRLPEASRFVESILLGLPVPGVFLAKEADSSKLLVIDGQQRLKTLQFFKGGIFNPNDQDKTQKVFKLAKVSERFDGLTYKDLEESDRRNFDDYVIHATIVKQDKPTNDDTSIYHIFERLNTTGQRLSAQEIRVAVYRGCLLNLLEELNGNSAWRQIFGKPHPRLKDRELILRFLAFHTDAKSYERPQEEFLSKFAANNRNPKPEQLEAFRKSFCTTIELIFQQLGRAAFRPERTFNAAVFDSVMVAVAKRLDRGRISHPNQIKTAYQRLMKNKKYIAAFSGPTADKPLVEERMSLAEAAFAILE